MGSRRQPAAGGYDPPPLDLREEQVVLETDRYRITGALTLPREGYRSRLSDYVNQRDREFLTISEARIEPLDASSGEVARTEPFLMIGRGHVRLIAPAGG